VVASRRPGNPVGWVLCSIGLSWGAYHFSSEYVTYALLAAPWSLPAAKAAAWIASWLWVPGLGLIVFLALLFPSGQLPSPRWRPFAWLSVLVVAVGTIMAAFSPGARFGLSVRNPLGIESLPNIYEHLQALMFALIFVASVSLLVRLHHARGVERHQIKWVAYAGALAASASLPTYTIFEVMDLRWLDMVGHVPALVGILGVPTAVGIAILRHRLYEIDLLINRTLVFGSLTAILVAHYFGSIVWLQMVFVELTGQRSTLAVVASTLVIAALFNPLHRWVQAFVDRRFYRRKYNARKTLGAFSAKLRDETDLDALRDDLVDVVRETMQPSTSRCGCAPIPIRRAVKARSQEHTRANELSALPMTTAQKAFRPNCPGHKSSKRLTHAWALPRTLLNLSYLTRTRADQSSEFAPMALLQPC
jgi:hypothetical protein